MVRDALDDTTAGDSEDDDDVSGAGGVCVVAWVCGGMCVCVWVCGGGRLHSPTPYSPHAHTTHTNAHPPTHPPTHVADPLLRLAAGDLCGGGQARVAAHQRAGGKGDGCVLCVRGGALALHPGTAVCALCGCLFLLSLWAGHALRCHLFDVHASMRRLSALRPPPSLLPPLPPTLCPRPTATRANQPPHPPLHPLQPAA
jgi:hypothetical protein